MNGIPFPDKSSTSNFRNIFLGEITNIFKILILISVPALNVFSSTSILLSQWITDINKYFVLLCVARFE